MTGLKLIKLMEMILPKAVMIFIIALDALYTPTLRAATYYEHESHARILEATREYLSQIIGTEYSSFEIITSDLDPSLKLAECNVPLIASSPPGGRNIGSVTVKLECNGDRPWSIYIPSKVRIFESVVVSKHPMSRGQVIEADNIVLAKRDITDFTQGYALDSSKVVGKILKQAIAANRIIPVNNLQAPALVKRGQEVTIIAGNSAVEIRMTGTALMDGAAGDHVRVRNLSSKRTIEAMVVGSGLVQVGM